MTDVPRHQSGEYESFEVRQEFAIERLENEIDDLRRKLREAEHDVRGLTAFFDNLPDLVQGIDEEVAGFIHENSEQIRTLLEEILEDLRSPTSCNEFIQIMKKAVSVMIPPSESLSHTLTFDISIADKGSLYLLLSSSHIKQIFANLARNALRKHATMMMVHVHYVGETSDQYMELYVEDDGDGMRPIILESVRKGLPISDKKPGDGFVGEGDHGWGLTKTRRIIEGIYGGKMFVDSTVRTDTSQEHGTAFKFLIPAYVHSAPVTSVEAVEEPVLFKASQSPINRRSALTRAMVAGGSLAAVTFAAFFGGRVGGRGRKAGLQQASMATTTAVEPVAAVQAIEASDAPEMFAWEDLIRDIRFDDTGRIEEFVLNFGKEFVTYKPGQEPSEFFESGARIDVDDVSLIVCNAFVRGKEKSRRMFVGRIGSHMMGLVHTPQVTEKIGSAYLCASIPEASASLHPLSEAFFPIQDGLYMDGQRTGTNCMLLASDALRSMRAGAIAMQESIPPKDRGQRFGNTLQILKILLHAQNMRDDSLHSIKTREAWDALLDPAYEAKSQFFETHPDLASHIRNTPLPRDRTRDLLMSGNHFCLAGIPADNVQHCIRV